MNGLKYGRIISMIRARPPQRCPLILIPYARKFHKAKGKEFDNVFLMLENFDASTDACRRQLYVAMTRAKKNLAIHLNSDLFDRINVDSLERIEDNHRYLPPVEIALQLTHKDIWLDWFIKRQHLVSQLVSGDLLLINGNECLDLNGQSVLKFSKTFAQKIDNLKSKNYELKSAKVNFIVFWRKDEATEEVKIVLPELHFEKTATSA